MTFMRYDDMIYRYLDLDNTVFSVKRSGNFVGSALEVFF